MSACLAGDHCIVLLRLRRRPHEFPALAGTVACTECGGAPIIRRHTPNLEHVFSFEEPFWFRVSQRLGGYYIGKESRPEQRPRQFLEYPSRPPVLKEGWDLASVHTAALCAFEVAVCLLERSISVCMAGAGAMHSSFSNRPWHQHWQPAPCLRVAAGNAANNVQIYRAR